MIAEETDTKTLAKSAGLLLVKLLAETVKDLKEVPSGVLYSMVMPMNVSLELYQAAVDVLKRSGLVTESHHLLTWVGIPKKGK